MIDRTVSPEIKPFGNIAFPEPEIIQLDNNIPLYLLKGGDQDISRLDVLFSAGRFDEEKALAAQLCNMMLKEGAGGLSSQEIAEKLDFHGAWLQPSVTMHNSYVSLYSLNKHFKPSLSIIAKMILSPEFPEKEFAIQTDRQLQQYKVEKEKVTTLAANVFAKQFFGAEHPYGKTTRECDFTEINISDLRRYYNLFYRPERCKIILSGQITDDMIRLVNQVLGQNKSDSSQIITPQYTIKRDENHVVFSEKSDSVQSAIRVGISLVPRNHPDYPGLRILNTFLGGYFGSRLMSNIREDKGYTYGIGSSVVTLPESTYLSIATQTGTEYVKPLIDEIFVETERLQNELIRDEEMNIVRSYLSGELARLVDTPLSVADAYVPLIANSLPFDYYQNQQATIGNITPEQLQALAKKYFNRNDFYIAIAGKQNPL